MKVPVHLLCCPRCRGELRLQGAWLSCPTCRLRWPVVAGVPWLVPEHQEPDPADADAET